MITVGSPAALRHGVREVNLNHAKHSPLPRNDSGISSETVVLKDGTTVKNDLTWSPDGNSVTVKGSDGTTEVWERAKQKSEKPKP